MDILIFIIILSFLVIIHELGHFISARIFKVGIEEFGVGYPPKAITLFRYKGIPFTLNWIPFGGFVRMHGELAEEGEEQIKKQVKDTKDSTLFFRKPAWQRLIVILAGATVNFLFGIIAFTTVLSFSGIPERILSTVVVSGVAQNSPAQQSGLMPLDKIIGNKEKGSEEFVAIQTNEAFITWVSSRAGKEIDLKITRGNEEKVIAVYVRKPEERGSNEGALGLELSQQLTTRFYPWYEMPFRAARQGITDSIDLSRMILTSLKDMIVLGVTQGKVPSEVAGPVGIAHEVQKTGIFRLGWQSILWFAGLISVNLAVMNVLPIPALDGGRAFFMLFERFMSEKRRAQLEQKVNGIGFALLLSLILLITLKDVIMIFR